MALMQWRTEYEIGIAEIDHEHRTLVETINALHRGLSDNPSKDAVGAVLGDIHARISAHFALEEKVMRERRYDQYAEHKAAHEGLLDELRDIMDAFEDDGYPDYERRLSAELNRWFSEHAKTMDARFHKFVQGAGGTRG